MAIKNETRWKVREKILESCLLREIGLVDTAADKIEEVVDIILFEIGGCVNSVPAAANDITVAVLKFIAETLERIWMTVKRLMFK